MESTEKKAYYGLVESVLIYRDFYEKGDPHIPDAIYDQLIIQLQAIEARNPEWILPHSPTQTVGSLNNLIAQGTFPHVVKMQSLDNIVITDGKGLHNFLSRTGIVGSLYSVEPKYDGLSVELVYSYGNLLRATTRGSGIAGHDYFENACKVKGVPTKIPQTKQLTAFTGEVVLPIAAFEHINAQKALLGEKLYSNPRNAAAGIFQGNGEWCEYLEFITWGVPVGLEGIDSHYDQLMFAHELKVGAGGRPEKPVVADLVLAAVLRLMDLRTDSKYLLDGIVVKVTSIKHRELFKEGRKAPLWATALKFEPTGYETTVTDIEFRVGVGGSITPVVKIDPVTIDGVAVSSINLHNLAVLQDMDLRISDVVLVGRVHDVNNQILSIDKDKRPDDAVPPSIPEKCPACHASLTLTVGRRKQLRCDDLHGCYGRHLGRLKAYLGPKGIGVPISFPVLKMLTIDDTVKSIPDLFKVRVEDFERCGLSNKVATRIVGQLFSALSLVHSGIHLAKLGIPGLGDEKATRLASEWLLDTLPPAILSVSGYKAIEEVVGEAAAKSLKEYCEDERGSDVLVRMGRLLGN